MREDDPRDRGHRTHQGGACEHFWEDPELGRQRQSEKDREGHRPEASLQVSNDQVREERQDEYQRQIQLTG